jgi:hypothetical protein
MNKSILAERTVDAIRGIQTEADTLAKRLKLDVEPVRDFYDRQNGVDSLLRLEAIYGVLKAANDATSPAAEIPTPTEVAAQHTVAELRDLIATADADALDRLEAAESEDNGGKGRKTVFDAIEKRRVQLLDELPNEAPAE